MYFATLSCDHRNTGNTFLLNENFVFISHHCNLAFLFVDLWNHIDFCQPLPIFRWFRVIKEHPGFSTFNLKDCLSLSVSGANLFLTLFVHCKNTEVKNFTIMFATVKTTEQCCVHTLHMLSLIHI